MEVFLVCSWNHYSHRLRVEDSKKLQKSESKAVQRRRIKCFRLLEQSPPLVDSKPAHSWPVLPYCLYPTASGKLQISGSSKSGYSLLLHPGKQLPLQEETQRTPTGSRHVVSVLRVPGTTTHLYFTTTGVYRSIDGRRLTALRIAYSECWAFMRDVQRRQSDGRVFLINDQKQLVSSDPMEVSPEAQSHLDDVVAFHLESKSLRTLSATGLVVKYQYDSDEDTYQMKVNTRIQTNKFSEDLYLGLLHGVEKPQSTFTTLGFRRPWTFVASVLSSSSQSKSSNKVYVMDANMKLLSQFALEAENSSVPGQAGAETRYYANPIQKFHFSRPLSSVLLVFCVHVSSQVSLLRLNPLNKLKGTLVGKVKLSSSLLFGSTLWRQASLLDWLQSTHKSACLLSQQLVVGGWQRPSSYQIHRLAVQINFHVD